jgi:hypothetical protein
MGIVGALGKMNLTSSNLDRRRQFSARDTQPAPLSPRPWAMMTVAVCFLTAGIMRDVGDEGGMARNVYLQQEEIVWLLSLKVEVPARVPSVSGGQAMAAFAVK